MQKGYLKQANCPLKGTSIYIHSLSVCFRLFFVLPFISHLLVSQTSASCHLYLCLIGPYCRENNSKGKAFVHLSRHLFFSNEMCATVSTFLSTLLPFSRTMQATQNISEYYCCNLWKCVFRQHLLETSWRHLMQWHKLKAKPK